MEGENNLLDDDDVPPPAASLPHPAPERGPPPLLSSSALRNQLAERRLACSAAAWHRASCTNARQHRIRARTARTRAIQGSTTSKRCANITLTLALARIHTDQGTGRHTDLHAPIALLSSKGSHARRAEPHVRRNGRGRASETALPSCLKGGVRVPIDRDLVGRSDSIVSSKGAGRAPLLARVGQTRGQEGHTRRRGGSRAVTTDRMQQGAAA